MQDALYNPPSAFRTTSIRFRHPAMNIHAFVFFMRPLIASAVQFALLRAMINRVCHRCDSPEQGSKLLANDLTPLPIERNAVSENILPTIISKPLIVSLRPDLLHRAPAGFIQARKR